MKLVVAADYPSFLDFCREHGLDPATRPKAVKFVQHYNDFVGLENCEVMCYGNWQENPMYKSPDVWEFFISYGKSKKWKMPEGE